MTLDAAGSSEISMLRRLVPEFEPEFQAELRAEEGAMGAFQALSLLAQWTAVRLAETPTDEALGRVFDAIEDLITESSFALGDALAAEFIEATWDNPAAVALMGPRTRERAAAR